MSDRTDETWREWTIFSHHGHVLFYVAANPEATIRAISDALGITERHVARILKHLETAGMVQVERSGRRNCYTVNPAARLRHPTLAHITLDRIVQAVTSAPAPQKRA
ncbi:MAG: MarR family transcriptional regulator [Chloroflexota bacterium]|nr:MarR family transcriptional regulator [Chloroflexota bacterium]